MRATGAWLSCCVGPGKVAGQHALTFVSAAELAGSPNASLAVGSLVTVLRQVLGIQKKLRQQDQAGAQGAIRHGASMCHCRQQADHRAPSS